VPDDAWFVNVRWQLYGPAAGQGQLWADDVELIRWEEWQPFERSLAIDAPNDLYYLQVETDAEAGEIEVDYRGEVFGY